jgi:hypothetical protein
MIELKPTQPFDEGLKQLGTISPKHSAIQRWRERKEGREFARLCKRLLCRKYYVEVRKLPSVRSDVGVRRADRREPLRPRVAVSGSPADGPESGGGSQ